MKYYFSKSRTPSRDEYLIRLCAAKNVLHIGACDAPYTRSKKETGLLLHEKISAVANEVVGIDIDQEAIALMQSYGFDNVIHFDMNCLDELSFRPDVVIFGETIEHLKDFSSTFGNIRKVMQDNAVLVITTPNAFYFSNFIKALKGYESNHPEHTVFFSPRTLDYMLSSSGFEVTQRTFSFLDRKKERWPMRLKKTLLMRFPLLCETLIYECRSGGMS
ncbi:MAG TPA: hypothetical protein DEA26_02435 [Oceanospirillales bacterium]|nr:hypothetical protein [Oceanospirillaceae bacterium]HBS41511.1 hypothetical protein [Oceanospirillales bacterium]